jgi:hypothetical protein
MKRALKYAAICLILIIALAGGLSLFGLRQIKYFPDVEVPLEDIQVDPSEIMAHIQKIVSFGNRLPGTGGDAAVRAYILQQFKEYSLQTQAPESYEVPMYFPKNWRLSLSDPPLGDTLEIPCFYMPFSASTEEGGITAPLVYVADGQKIDELDLTGKIAAYDMICKPKGLKLYAKLLFMHDPDHTLDSSGQVVRPKLEFEYEMFGRLKGAGALGMIGLLGCLQWDSDHYYPQMSFGLEKSIPGVWVRPSYCEAVREKARKGGVEATMVVTSSTATGKSANIHAILPGRIEEYYLVFSQHDTYFDGAVQDASGVAVVLALARHFSHTDRPLKRGVVFMTLSHVNGRLGEKAFIEMHRSNLLAKTALAAAIEHIGRELDPQPDLSFKVSERPSFRMMFTTLNRKLNAIVKSALIKQDYRRSVIVPQWLVEKITGKARGISAEFHEMGLPVVGFMSNPPYMFFPQDTPAAVAADQLVPTVQLMASILRAADELTWQELR